MVRGRETTKDFEIERRDMFERLELDANPRRRRRVDIVCHSRKNIRRTHVHEYVQEHVLYVSAVEYLSELSLSRICTSVELNIIRTSN